MLKAAENNQQSPHTSFGNLVILGNLSSAFSFSKELEKNIYFNHDLPYITPDDPKKFEELTAMQLSNIINAVLSGYSIVFMHNTPLNYNVINTLRTIPINTFYPIWQFISFFHDDRSILEADMPVRPVRRIEIKTQELNKMKPYPFIRKIYIPFGQAITTIFLAQRLSPYYSANEGMVPGTIFA
jgi:hypothetical protein